MKEVVADTALTNTREIEQWLAFKAGDMDAFARLLDQYYPLLLRYGYKLYPDKEFVKDCVHDLFIGLWNSRDRLADVGSVKGYLFASLRKNIIREKSRSKWLTGVETLDDDVRADDGFHIEAMMIAREHEQHNVKKLQFHLDQLTNRQREALYLKYTQELSYEQVAATMGINYRSAVNLVHEAVKSVRKSWTIAFIWAISIFA
ncbi:RNA polymerase sigma factor [Dyadobacter alkalitolerans]|uniref:RNA polymerase sigma factor n=1 Tax=Dyadobacter alkalitolerans TaxID=492736 RepID=UPI00042A24A4|nr:sigma-70 family RNA polymerase sigma factor [Dyadobacter alkalitolerans]